jgi:hypothetical protein
MILLTSQTASRRSFALVLLGVACLMLGPSRASADLIDITTAMGNGADAAVKTTDAGGDNGANTNFGAGASVGIKHDGGGGAIGNSRKGYLRFDITGVLILDLELDVTVAIAAVPSGTYNVFGLNDGHAGEAWDESTITWNNAPGNDTLSKVDMLGAETTLLGTFFYGGAYPVGTHITFSSLALLNFALADTNGLLTLAITRQTIDSSSLGIASKEHASLDAPTLHITTVPEPGTWLTVTAGSLGLIGRAWRRRRNLRAGS